MGTHQRKALLVPHDLMSRGWNLRQQPSQTKHVHIMSNVATYRRPFITNTQLKRRVKLTGKSLFHEALPNCSLARASSRSLTLILIFGVVITIFRLVVLTITSDTKIESSTFN